MQVLVSSTVHVLLFVLIFWFSVWLRFGYYNGRLPVGVPVLGFTLISFGWLHCVVCLFSLQGLAFLSVVSCFVYWFWAFQVLFVSLFPYMNCPSWCCSFFFYRYYSFTLCLYIYSKSYQSIWYSSVLPLLYLCHFHVKMWHQSSKAEGDAKWNE